MSDDIILVDSHCHLDDFRFEDDTTEALLERASEVGVKYAQTICTQRSDFQSIHDKTQQFKNLYCSFGVHPHHAGEEGVTAEEIFENAQKDKVIGIGETGLDYYYENAPRNEQIKSFEMHLEVAQELDMPVIIHTRDAEEDTISILKNFSRDLKRKGVIHSFTSKKFLAEFALNESFYIGFNGIISFKNAKDVQEIASFVPVKSTLLETDAPFLTPVPYRGQENAPHFIPYIAYKLLEIRKILNKDQDAIEHLKQIYSNSVNLFSL